MKLCPLDAILPDTGVCALVNGRQIAIFRVNDRIYAIDNFDPFSKANVLSRGIVGDLKGELVVASPVYKQHFSLTTGRCAEDPDVRVAVHPVSVEGAYVVTALPGSRYGSEPHAP
jgi:nitrite reductase (NADH) small subunit